MAADKMPKPKVDQEQVRSIYSGQGSNFWGLTLGDLREIVKTADEQELLDSALVSTASLKPHASRKDEQHIQSLIIREVTEQ